ncbi:MAG: hypothetical protein ACRDQX_11075 [Pseudonocardiaceae bacterium]
MTTTYAMARDTLDSAADIPLVVCGTIGAGLLVLLAAIGIWRIAPSRPPLEGVVA